MLPAAISAASLMGASGRRASKAAFCLGERGRSAGVGVGLKLGGVRTRSRMTERGQSGGVSAQNRRTTRVSRSCRRGSDSRQQFSALTNPSGSCGQASRAEATGSGQRGKLNLSCSGGTGTGRGTGVGPSACSAISLSMASWVVATSAQRMGPLQRGQCETSLSPARTPVRTCARLHGRM